jgi:anti-anti-sigma factor
MVTAQTDAGWQMDVDRGPDWMFVRLHPGDSSRGIDDFSLAEKVWSVLEQCFTYRLVLELDRVPMLQSGLIAQMVLLSKRVHSHSGTLRLCGLSPENQKVLQLCRLEGCLPSYDNRSEAVMGEHRPAQPR